MSPEKNLAGSTTGKRKQAYLADEKLLQTLGYKQEFRREFIAFEVFGSMSSVASIDWGCAVQIMAAATIGSKDQSFIPTSGQTYLVYLAIIASHALETLRILFRSTVSGYSAGFAFFISWLAPAWTIGKPQFSINYISNKFEGAFDSSVHISEEATNAATAVPWAIVGAIGISGFLGTIINIVLAFCAGTDIESIINNPIGQPMATIIFNSLSSRGTLALWSIIASVQYMMGGSILLAASRQTFAFSRDGALPFSKDTFIPGPFSLGRWSLLIVIIAITFMTFTIFFFPTSPNPDVQDMNCTVVVIGGAIFGCLGWYYFPVYGGVHWFNGPMKTVQPASKDSVSSTGPSDEKKTTQGTITITEIERKQ
ncbi:hypothetical protein Clacol_007547 [Clathrus columnatus]|uniref:Uncharacterized protein n=1 Tax=Clathrus columnatus TaxID=1419009 RepID=A0AAV5AK93_9AGAM|nr:hypothetical protein Clacol_007547 [Clathrus columnatus]